MGFYFNPGNETFRYIKRGSYIDRTGILDYLNHVLKENSEKQMLDDLDDSIDQNDWLICLSLPRRSGKTLQAETIISYYDCSCDSHELFDGLAISACASYEEHMNQYHVLRMDVAEMISDAGQIQNIVPYIEKELKEDLLEEYEDLHLSADKELKKLLADIVKKTNRKFIFVIDEWDAVIRNAGHDRDTQQAYLNLLRSWFKDINFTNKVIALVYMTGILPVKKDKGQSALSDFKEYSILSPGPFGPYIGFHEEDVLALCKKKNRDPDEIKEWYEGYRTGDYHFYNPYSVINAVTGPIQSYWRMSSASETLLDYIRADFEGLQQDIADLTAGEVRDVNIAYFQNDTVHFTCKDDVFTLLVHLGYLTYEPTGKSQIVNVRIPNEEVRMEFVDMIKTTKMSFLCKLAAESQKLLVDTLAMKADEVAASFEKLHNSRTSPSHYSDEQALRYLVKYGYIIAQAKYMIVDEFPSGRGYADVAMIPKRFI